MANARDAGKSVRNDIDHDGSGKPDEPESDSSRWGTEKVRWKKILKGYGPPFCFL